MTIRRPFTILLAAGVVVTCLLAAACGGGGHPLAPVSGRVMLDGEPLAGAKIGFEPMREGKELDAGQGAYATTDESGSFTLTALDGTKGAVVGKHRVWIRTLQAREDETGKFIVEREELLPERYHDRTELTFTVEPSGSNRANFDLKSH